MGADLLLVAGIPATGKTRFGVWLEGNHGYAHVDWENGDSRDRWELEGVFRECNEMLVSRISSGENPELVGEDCGPIIADAVTSLGERVVLDWGFPPYLWRAVAYLGQHGFSLWWFDADTDLARTVFEGRSRAHRPSDIEVQEDLAAFDTQIENIRIWRRQIQNLFGPNVIRALEDSGDLACLADIHHQICGGSTP